MSDIAKLRAMTMIRWRHKDPIDPPHHVEPHYDGTGHWVCYKCRAPITDAGKTVSMTPPPGEGILVADPDAIGLHTDGS